MNDYEILEQLPERQFLDMDLYKFTMLWFVMNYYPNAKVRYDFIDRNNNKYPEGLGRILRKRIDTFRDMKLSKEHRLAFQKKCYFLPNLFFDFLEGYRVDPSDVSISQDSEGHLSIYSENYWYRTILWEIIIMSEVAEINFLMTGEKPDKSREELKDYNIQKGVKLRMNDVPFVDFGTRRRYSFENQKNVIQDLIIGGGEKFIGTSNVYLSILYDIKLIGTAAHELTCGVATKLGYDHANGNLMKMWNDLFHGSLGIVLPDSFGLKSFLNDFDGVYARLYDGTRHDSGDPYKYADTLIKHYCKYNINPSSKTIAFSNALDVDRAIALSDYCRGKISMTACIGTHFTCDVGVKPLNIVMKLTMLDGKHVIKLSDEGGKHTGDKRTIELVKELINYEPLD